MAVLAALRDCHVARVLAVVPDTRLYRDPGIGAVDRRPLPVTWQRAPVDPRLRRRPLLMLLDAHGIECSTGSAYTTDLAWPSHVLLAVPPSDSARVGALLPRVYVDRRRRRRGGCGDRVDRR
jgi:cysteine desulfurase